jgi:hypothetical protein
MLLMKKRFFDDIRSGKKCTTLRYWRNVRARPGSIHTVPGLGRVRIERVSRAKPDDITDDDARNDGFASAAELHQALAELYPLDRRQGRTLYKVQFTLIH